MAHTGIDEDHIVLQQPGLPVPAVFRPSMEQDIQFIFRFMPVVAEVHHLMDISGAEQVFPGPLHGVICAHSHASFGDFPEIFRLRPL